MNTQEKIKNIINGRPCFVLAKGASLRNLEEKIVEYKDLDVCWVTLNDFNYIENSILSKINKRFELVSSCDTVLLVKEYENSIRIPRFTEYLERKDNNLLMLSNLVIQQCFYDQKREDLYEKYKHKIVSIEDLFSMETCPKEVWDKPPNSITLLYAFLIAGGAKKIVLFGLDGFQPNIGVLASYYMPEVVTKERKDAFGDYRDGSLKTDTSDFNQRWNNIFEMYKKAFDNQDVKIYNCSPITTVKAIQKIDFSQVRGIINV